jgi:hypothetical protein
MKTVSTRAYRGSAVAVTVKGIGLSTDAQLKRLILKRFYWNAVLETVPLKRVY